MDEENGCDVNIPTYIDIQKMNTVDNTDNDYHWSENKSNDDESSESDEMVSFRLLEILNTCSD